MKTFKTSCLVMCLFTALCGIIYPLFMYGVGQLFFRHEASGSLLYRDGKVIGSTYIGQDFTGSQYFHPRPSSAGSNGYDASNSSGSNLGPTSQVLSDALKKRLASYRTENQIPLNTTIPADAITTSGSGLDPHISVQNALLQMPRVAIARGLSQEEVKKIINSHTEDRTWGLLGEERVHVLRMNLALDQIKQK